VAALPSAAHIGFVAWPDLDWDCINRMRRSQIECPKIRPSPSEIGDELGKADFAEQVAACGVDPDTSGRSDPYIAALIAFHAIGHAGLELGTDAACENARIGERAVGFNVEHSNKSLRGVINVKLPLVG